MATIYEEADFMAESAYAAARAVLPRGWGMIIVVGQYGESDDETSPISVLSEVRDDVAAGALRWAADMIEKGTMEDVISTQGH